MKKVAYALSLAFVVLTFWACTKEMDDVIKPRTLDRSALNADYSDLVAQGWNVPSTNNARISLGRVLFYDTKLSFNNTISCGSCHKQQFAFSDNTPFSPGFKGVNSLRNSKPIQNIGAFGQSLFWDGRADSLAMLVTMPIQNHIEMGFEKVQNLPAKLANEEYYAQLFKDAFGTEEITVGRITTAMRDFISIIRSSSSRMEQLQNGGIINGPNPPPFIGGGGFNIWNNTVAGFTPEENEGMQLFVGKARCSNCHSGSNLEGWDNANNGLEVEYTDKGIGALHPGQNMDGMFKIPALRNIELTGPYMHDGRLKTLEDVVDFYDSGVQASANLDYRLRDIPGGVGGVFVGGPFEGDGIIFDPNGGQDLTKFGPVKLGLTAHEKHALVAFLKTLTDHKFITDQRLSNPFRVQ